MLWLLLLHWAEHLFGATNTEVSLALDRSCCTESYEHRWSSTLTVVYECTSNDWAFGDCMTRNTYTKYLQFYHTLLGENRSIFFTMFHDAPYPFQIRVNRKKFIHWTDNKHNFSINFITDDIRVYARCIQAAKLILHISTHMPSITGWANFPHVIFWIRKFLWMSTLSRMESRECVGMAKHFAWNFCGKQH